MKKFMTIWIGELISLMAAGVFMALTGTTTSIRLIVVFCILFFTALPFVNACADVLVVSRYQMMYREGHGE